jgi:hypothetical protein
MELGSDSEDGSVTGVRLTAARPVRLVGQRPAQPYLAFWAKARPV